MSHSHRIIGFLVLKVHSIPRICLNSFKPGSTHFYRHQKNSRIINWICQGQGSELQGPNLFEPPDLENELLDYSLEEDIEQIIPGPANE